MRGALTSEEQDYLDKAFYNLDIVKLCQDLINSYLQNIIKEDVSGGRVRRRSVESRRKVSNRKQRRIQYTKFQRLYKKNRKKAYDSIYNNNSISENLDSTVVFGYWEDLLTHITIKEPNLNNLQTTEAPVYFDESLLIYPEVVEKFNPRGKSSAVLDGLSVYDTLKINNRVKAKPFSLFLLLHWITDVLINSRIIFIPKKHNTSSPAQL